MLVMGLSAASLAAAGLAAVAIQPAPALAASTATGGSGASLPYTEVQAESSATNGTIIGPSYTQGQLADEASGRKAVTLAGNGSGQYVTFTTPVSTNSIDFRYSIPDTSDGSVYTAPLSLYINGTKQSDFTLTNAYSWYYGSYPFVNTPGSGNPHHFYDEVHRLFTTTYPAGTTFKLEVDSEDTASSYTIDLADFENVAAALTQPSGSVSVVSEGADPTGVNDSTNAFNAAITAAGSGGTVWIPPGTYNIPGHIIVNNVTVEGAGMWYSTVTGTAPGFYGNSAPNPSTGVHLSELRDLRQRAGARRQRPGQRHRRGDEQLDRVEHLDRAHEGRRLDGRADDRPDLQRHAHPRHHGGRHQLPWRRHQLHRNQQRHPQHR